MTTIDTLARRRFMTGCASLAALAGIPAAWAQAKFPDRPLRAIVPFPPGGASDSAMRFLGNEVASILGQPIVVENRGGGGSTIGITAAAKSSPDGYTFVIVANSYAANMTLRNDLQYKASELTPLAIVGVQPSLLVVRPSLGVKTIPELLAAGKKLKLSYATFGSGTTPHMAMETFKTETGLDATHVPYKGEAQGLQDMLGGTMDMMFGTMSTMLPHVEQGKLVALAVGTTNRSVIAPSIPTVREVLKLKRFNFDSWFILMAPSATPPDRLNVLSSAFKGLLKRPAVQEALLKRGIEPIQGADDVEAFLDANIKEYAEVIRRSKITLD